MSAVALSLFSTTALPAAKSLPLWLGQWGDLIGRTTGKLQADACGQDTFDGQMEYAQLGRIGLFKIRASAHRVIRNGFSPTYADTRGFKVVIQTRGGSIVEQEGRRAELSPGQWTLYDAGKPYSVVNPHLTEQYVILLPRDAFANLHVPVENFTARSYCARSGVGRLACGIVRVAFEEFSAQHLQSTHLLGDTIARLLQQALLDHAGLQEADGASRAEQMRERIKTYIGQHLRDPNLCIERIAEALHQTKRNLHRLFVEEGVTISDFIWRQRLQVSCKTLDNTSMAHLSITEVAYGCGFSGSAHFSRTFKGAFGMSPRDYRNRARKALLTGT